MMRKQDFAEKGMYRAETKTPVSLMDEDQDEVAYGCFSKSQTAQSWGVKADVRASDFSASSSFKVVRSQMKQTHEEKTDDSKVLNPG